MKDGIHPEYRDVVFVDLQTGNKFVTRSTLNSRETTEIDGKTYPLFKCDVTSESHPFLHGCTNTYRRNGPCREIPCPLCTYQRHQEGLCLI
jgi:ribosomal protein L31